MRVSVWIIVALFWAGLYFPAAFADNLIPALLSETPAEQTAVFSLDNLDPAIFPETLVRFIRKHARSWANPLENDPSPSDLSGQSLRTFALTGPLKKPLRVYVQPEAAENEADNLRYGTLVAEALEAWGEALSGRLRYAWVSDPQQADIQIRWTHSFEDPYQAGETAFSQGHASIQIKTDGMSDMRIKANLLHELGHALGIAGHSPDNDDIMVATRDWGKYRVHLGQAPQLSERDKLAIQRLYSSHWRPGEDLYQAIQSETAHLP